MSFGSVPRPPLHTFAMVICFSLGCAQLAESPTAPTKITLGKAFDLRVAETATLPDESLTVRFERVVSDFRCPVDVTCVWEGGAVVALELQKSGRDAMSFELHTQANAPNEVAYLDYRTRLLELAPQPVDGAEIPPNSYIATFVVSRKVRSRS